MSGVRRSPELIAEALHARRAGEPRTSVSERLTIPAATLLTWERGRLPRAARAFLSGEPVCATCGWHHPHDQLGREYTYLLGVYLGDGYLVEYARTIGLKVALDVRYPGIIDEVSRSITAVRGQAPHVTRDPSREMVLVTSYWRGWPCLFPQHGPGRKHHRPIHLTPWQSAIADRHPGELARGLIHTDGWRGENRVNSKGRSYSYPRYQFSNRSRDIREIFCRACDQLGVAWRPWGPWHISVATRDAVARLDQHVGPKR